MICPLKKIWEPLQREAGYKTDFRKLTDIRTRDYREPAGKNMGTSSTKADLGLV